MQLEPHCSQFGGSLLRDDIGNDGARALAEALKTNTTLTTLE